MPIYEYHCPKCGELFERFVRSFSTQQAATCPRCGSTEVEKLVSTFAGGGPRSPEPAACTTGST